MADADRILVRLEEGPGSVTVHLDGGESLTVAPDALPANLPAIGGSLGSPLVHELRAAAARKLAARDLLALLDRKRWTTVRLRERLLGRGHPETAVEAVLLQAERQGLHADRDFADAFCRDALRHKQVGRMWLESRLRQKGIDAGLAADVAARHLPSDREHEVALEAAASRWRREGAADARALGRVQRFLISRGFPCAMANRAARATQPADSACNSDAEGPS
ncbi:MAG: regulatory protein RecX [Candidatus Krumholzibacteriia bacterium]